MGNQDKKKKRTKRLQKQRNMKRNLPRHKYRLQIIVAGKWEDKIGLGGRPAAKKYCEDMQALMNEGKTTIIPGRIVGPDGKIMAYIEGYDPVQIDELAGPQGYIEAETDTKPEPEDLTEAIMDTDVKSPETDN